MMNNSSTRNRNNTLPVSGGSPASREVRFSKPSKEQKAEVFITSLNKSNESSKEVATSLSSISKNESYY